MIYVDSNCWIYWLDSRLPEHKDVVDPMRRAVSKGILMSYTTLVEVAHYLRRLPPEEFLSVTATLRNLSTVSFAGLDDETAQLVVELLPRYSGMGLGGRDCVIIATMKTRGVKDILTHDRAFQRIEGLRVIDPVPRR